MSEGLSRERIGGGASRGSAGSFLPAKRPRTDITDHGSERRLFRISEESDDGDKEVDAERKLMQFSTARAAVNGSHWRLARDHSVADNEVYLSEQLEHVAALAAIMEGNQRGLQSEEQGRECTLRVSALWQLVCGGKSGLTKKEAVEADKHIRDTMDTISFLLHVRNQEVDHQNYLGEKTRMLEKEAERKQHVIQTLRAEVESQKQTIAHQQNKLKAEEEASKAEKKALQTEKKALEVQCVRSDICSIRSIAEGRDVDGLCDPAGCKASRRPSRPSCGAKTPSTSACARAFSCR